MNNVSTVSLSSVAIARLVAAVASLPGVRFAGVTYRSKESGELARHTLILGASYENLTIESLQMLTDMGGVNLSSDVRLTNELEKAKRATLAGSPERRIVNAELRMFQDSIGAQRAALAELFTSYLDTLTAHASGQQNARYTKLGVYETIFPGLTVSRTDGTYELHGLSHAKKVLEAGTYPHVNSSAKTLAKQAIEKALPRSKYRTLALDEGALESVRIGGRDIDVSEIC